mmetsp:Transcript_27478/g.59665  ORF Transcript_27478/g.59665 Transcript_27478/m.59665 type:complete len:143 (-) Transcript_27478:105-533(-)
MLPVYNISACRGVKPGHCFRFTLRLKMTTSNEEVTVEIFKAGDGMNYPEQGQTVAIHYTACFLKDDGTCVEFDSTRHRKPFKFNLFSEQVIPGLCLGVSQLSIGEQGKITIPSSLAFGDKGLPALVPKNADLTFMVELLGFK